MASPYEVLGVDPDADAETVERRYRELVKEVHPDAGGSAEEFKRVKEAYREIAEGDATAGGSSSTGDVGYGKRQSDSGSTGQTGGGSGTGAGAGAGTAGTSGTGTGGSGAETGTGTGGSDGTTYTAGQRRRQRSSSSRGASGASGASGAAGRSRSGRRESRGDDSSSTRRAFLYGTPPLLVGGAVALAHREGLFADQLNDSSASGTSTREDTVSRELAPDDLFDVEFQGSAGATVHFTVDGADSSDWVNVYTQEEFQWVRSNYEETGEFDPGDPIQTVLTGDGYEAELPGDETYVILVKLWEGPPDDPREPRTVEISYRVPA